MLSKDFEVYYYSDLHFQSVGSHSHAYYELYFFVEGAVDMEIGSRRFPLRPGDVVIVPPGIAHRGLIRDGSIPYRRFVFWISRDYCRAMMEQSPDYAYLFQHVVTSHRNVYHFDVIRFNALRGKLLDLLDELHGDRFARSAGIALRISDLLLTLNRAVYDQQHAPLPQESRTQYEAVVSYIDGHLEENLTLDRIAAEFYISKYYIAHLFQQNLGLSVHQYITKKRLALCRDAMLGGTGITAACTQSGFHDYSSFYRAFKKEYGVSPALYAELHRPEKE